MRKLTLMCYCLTVALTFAALHAHAFDAPIPDWPAVFNPDGTVRSLNGGLDAVYIQENISAGIATDMTALNAAGGFVYNGPVPRAHDLGNGYAFATLDAEGKLVVAAAVERLVSTADSFVEFEFNQGVVGVTSGAPWPLKGGRTVNDILVRLNLVSGDVGSVELKLWDGTGFVRVQSASASSPSGCFVVSDSCGYCSGAAVAGLPPTNGDVWDSLFRKVSVPSADAFVQTSVNVGRLLGRNVEFTSIVMRTPEDIILGSFRAIGYWASVNVPAVQ